MGGETRVKHERGRWLTSFLERWQREDVPAQELQLHSGVEARHIGHCRSSSPVG
jgi:hypothetical protein